MVYLKEDMQKSYLRMSWNQGVEKCDTYHNTSITLIKSALFDHAATFGGTSLNKELQGPDLIKTLIGVLLRFR